MRPQLGHDPLDGSPHVFFNRSLRMVKVLCWEGDGFSIGSRRLERGQFSLPRDHAGNIWLETRLERLRAWKWCDPGPCREHPAGDAREAGHPGGHPAAATLPTAQLQRRTAGTFLYMLSGRRQGGGGGRRYWERPHEGEAATPQGASPWRTRPSPTAAR